MMALSEGCQYGLLSRDSVTAAKLSCAHVKLTDAALKVIEDYQLGKKSGSRPTIEILDDTGIIRIPDGRGYKDFMFTVRPQPTDPNGSYDCIKQARNGKLEMLDTMSQRITVSATDEVYQTTRDKLAVKNEESKKYCAKEIDQTKGGVKSKKITKTIRTNQNGFSSATRPSSIAQSNSKQTKNEWPSPANTRSPNTIPSQGASGLASSPSLASSVVTAQPNTYNSSATNANSQTSAAKKLDKLKRKTQSKRNTAAKEAAVAHNKTSGPSKSEKEKIKAALLAVPLRERIVHTLAAKPNMFDTTQILAKLKGEGLNSSEHSVHIVDILKLVGITNNKNCWALRTEYFGEVDVNWSFYSETDKQLVKRHLNRPISSSVASTGSATGGGGGRPVVAVHPTSDNSKRKKSSEEADGDLPLSKRERLGLDPTNEDFLKNYTIITTSDQRNRYKDDFNSDYQEYKTLFDYIEEVNKKFRNLADQLYAADPGSDKYKKIEKKIRKKYKEIAYSSEYRSKKPRLDYLHNKLSHIKSIVHDYDTASWNISSPDA